MDATNQELYKLVIVDAPYVIGAYAVLWIALCGYITLVLRRLLRLEKELVLLEETAARRSGASA